MSINVEPALLQRMVRFIKGAGARLEEMAEDREQAKQAAPQVVDDLIARGLLGAENKSAAVQALAESHARTIETLRKTASYVGVDKKASDNSAPPALGKPAEDQTKAAAARGESEALQQASQNFLAALGFNR